MKISSEIIINSKLTKLLKSPYDMWATDILGEESQLQLGVNFTSEELVLFDTYDGEIRHIISDDFTVSRLKELYKALTGEEFFIKNLN